jgi:hypothetical protein
MRPPCARTIDWQMARPRPLPGTLDCVAARRRKKGSKIRWRSSTGIPGPSSSIVNSNSPSAVVRARTPIGVRGGEYLIAFWSRLASTHSIWPASIRTTGRLGGIRRRTARSPSKPRIRCNAPSTTPTGSVNARFASGAMLPPGTLAVRSDSTSCASRSVSRSISARNSLRASSSHSTSVRRKLVTNPLM